VELVSVEEVEVDADAEVAIDAANLCLIFANLEVDPEEGLESVYLNCWACSLSIARG
jgi:hypothetical protein